VRSLRSIGGFLSYDQHFMRPGSKQIKSFCFLSAMASLREPLFGEHLQKWQDLFSFYAHYIHYMLLRIGRFGLQRLENIFMVSRHCTSLGSCFLRLLDPSIKWLVEPVAFTLGILWRPHGKVKQTCLVANYTDLIQVHSKRLSFAKGGPCWLFKRTHKRQRSTSIWIYLVTWLYMT